MRIGILTHPLDFNYGCLLQAYALQHVLKEMGHEVVTINRYTNPSKPIGRQLMDWIYRVYSRCIRGRETSVLWNPNLSLSEIEVLCSKTSLFVARNITNTGIVFDEDLPEIDKKYNFDAYVVGSDQVWLPHFCPTSFLDFVKREGVKKIFYAASAGKYSFADSPVLAKECRQLVKCFNGISVREDYLVSLAESTLGVKPLHVLDPTLLLNSEDYVDACVEEEVRTPIVFTYILDKTEEKKKIIESVRGKYNLDVISGTIDLDYRKGCGMKLQQCIYPSVDNWILNLKRASFVVTDSFHGTCMSIVFNKPFVVIGNVDRGIERIKSLLHMFKLEGRLINSIVDLNDSIYSEMPKDMIDSILKVKREESYSFLRSSLL